MELQFWCGNIKNKTRFIGYSLRFQKTLLMFVWVDIFVAQNVGRDVYLIWSLS